MRKAMYGILAALGLGLAGCGSGTTAASDADRSPAAMVEGKWFGKLVAVGGQGEAEKELAVLYRNSIVELDLKSGGRFTFDMMGTPIEGEYSLDGEKITLKYETMMGKSVNDPNSPLGFLGEGFLQPEVGTIRAGGSEIFFPARPGQPSEAEITFTRNRPESPAPGPKSVSAEEEAFVGTYVFDPTYELPKPETEAMEKAQVMLRNMMSGFRLELRSDNTFDLTMMLMMKGKWKLEKGQLNLDLTEPEMKAITGGPSPNIQLRQSDKPGQLLVLNDKTGRVDFAVRRESGP